MVVIIDVQPVEYSAIELEIKLYEQRGVMTNQSPSSGPRSDLWQVNRGLSKNIELLVKVIFGFFAFVSVATTIGIVLTLLFETVAFFQEVSLWNFLTDTQWTPRFSNPQFGIFVLISATVMTSAIAIMVALPLGLMAAIYLSEYAAPKTRKLLKPALEILAGVPSVVFGYFALLTVSPVLQTFIPGLQGFNALSAGLVLGISILPLVASLSEDAIFFGAPELTGWFLCAGVDQARDDYVSSFACGAVGDRGLGDFGSFQSHW